MRFERASGGFAIRRAELLRGRRPHELAAPLDELPMLIRAGSIVPLLSPDVDTLASHGDAPGLVHLSERRDRLRLLAFPRGRSNAGFFERERLVSRERRGSWTLRIEGRRKRRYSIDATMATLRRPFRPCRVELGGKALPGNGGATGAGCSSSRSAASGQASP